MSNEFKTTPDGPEAFPEFAYGISYADKKDEAMSSFFFGDAEPPTETDLLPDDDTDDYFGTKTSLKTYEYDVAVIGGGPAGCKAAICAAQRGAKVMLFEKEMLGGSDLTAGSIPSSVYLHIAETLRAAKSASAYSMSDGVDVSIDLKQAIASKDNTIAKISSNVARLLRAYRIRVEAGQASLKSAHEIHCCGRVYSVSKIILCGGGRIVYPEIPGLTHPGALNPGDIFKLSEVPPRLLVLGGSADGCEIAAAFAMFGSHVMLVESKPGLLPGMDAQVAEAMEAALTKTGVKVYTGISVKEIKDRDGNPFVVTERGGVLCDKVMITSGHKPDLSCLGSLANDIALNGDAVAVNDYSETSVSGIYAAGDITGSDHRLAATYRMAEIAAGNATGEKRCVDLSVVPGVILTKPEIAFVGLTEEEAAEKYGDGFVVGFVTLEDNVRTILTGRTEGFVKVLAGKQYGEILGVHIVSANASEMIAEPAALMKMEVTIHEVVNDIIHAHPTYAEVFRAACAAALDKCNRTGSHRT